MGAFPLAFSPPLRYSPSAVRGKALVPQRVPGFSHVSNADRAAAAHSHAVLLCGVAASCQAAPIEGAAFSFGPRAC